MFTGVVESSPLDMGGLGFKKLKAGDFSFGLCPLLAGDAKARTVKILSL